MRILYIGAMAGILLGSFVLTLWYIDANTPEPSDGRPISERLAERDVPNYSEVSRVAARLGIKLSNRMGGNVDQINRINERDVTMRGWLADPEGDATPLRLVVFVTGRSAGTTQTRGERPDVIHRLGLGFGAEKNVAFQLDFACQPGEQPIVVGLGAGKQYYPLSSRPCP